MENKRKIKIKDNFVKKEKSTNKGKGMSLITLLIFIALIVIISSTVIFFINKNNVIKDAKKVSVLSQFATFYEELNIYIQDKLSDTQGNFNVENFNVDSNDLYSLYQIIPSIKDSYFETKVGIKSGKLDISNLDDKETKDYILEVFFTYE